MSNFLSSLGSVSGHKELCEAWDARQKVRDQIASGENPEVIDLNNLSDPVETSAKAPEQEENEQQCLSSVLDIFPQISPKYVLKLYSKRLVSHLDNNYQKVFEFPDVGEIIADIAEMESYPKQADEDRENKRILDSSDETGVILEFNKNTHKDALYHREAIILLARFFDHVPTHYIHKTYHEKLSVFDTYVSLANSEANYFTLPTRSYARSRAPRVHLEKKYSLHKHDRRDPRSYIELVNEFQAARQHIERERLKTEAIQLAEIMEAENLAEQKLEGAIVECQCCFDEEIALNRAIGCGGAEVHFFCFSCVRQLAETQIGMMQHEMMCMDGSGCAAALSIEGIGQAVNIKIVDKLAFYQQQAEIMAAGIEGLEQCPFCEFKAICDSIEVETVFFCQNPDCGRSSCRKCHENTHLPRTCEEAKADKGLSARHQVEEARSEAMMRPCPKCGVKIVKEYGCNKMICTKCNCLICYVCKKDISTGRESGYEHFNRAGSKCKLYEGEEGDRHQEEADEAEREAIKRVRTENPDVEEDALRIDLDKDGNRKDGGRPANPRPRGGNMPRHLHNHFHFDPFGWLPGYPFADDLQNVPPGRPFPPLGFGDYFPGWVPPPEPMPAAPAPAPEPRGREAAWADYHMRRIHGRMAVQMGADNDDVNAMARAAANAQAYPFAPPAYNGPQQVPAPEANNNVDHPPLPLEHLEQLPPRDYYGLVGPAGAAKRVADRQRAALAFEPPLNLAGRQAHLNQRMEDVGERINALRARDNLRRTRQRGGGGEPDPIIVSDDNDEELDMLEWEKDGLTDWAAFRKDKKSKRANAVEETTAGSNTRTVNPMPAPVPQPMFPAAAHPGWQHLFDRQTQKNPNLPPWARHNDIDWEMDLDDPESPDDDPRIAPRPPPPKLQPPSCQATIDKKLRMLYEAEAKHDDAHVDHAPGKTTQPGNPYFDLANAHRNQQMTGVFGNTTGLRRPRPRFRTGYHRRVPGDDPARGGDGQLDEADHFEGLGPVVGYLHGLEDFKQVPPLPPAKLTRRTGLHTRVPDRDQAGPFRGFDHLEDSDTGFKNFMKGFGGLQTISVLPVIPAYVPVTDGAFAFAPATAYPPAPVMPTGGYEGYFLGGDDTTVRRRDNAIGRKTKEDVGWK